MCFHFAKEVDPKNPLDPNDPPPHGWHVVNTKDRIKAMPGHADDIYLACLAWQRREISRQKRLETWAVAIALSGYGIWAEPA